MSTVDRSATPDRTRRQYGSGSVFQRKDGMWIGRFSYRAPGDARSTPVTVSATTETRCKEKLEAKKMEIARNGLDRAAAKPASVADWCAQWLAIVVEDLTPNAYAASASAVRVWIIPTIGHKRLDGLTAADVRAVATAQRKVGRKEGSVIRTHAVLMKLLKDAVREEHQVRQSVLLAKSPKPTETDEAAMAVEEALAILAIAAEGPTPSRWAATLLQAMRQGECLGLTRDCVDFENHVMDISWQLQPLPYLDNRNKHLGFRVPAGYVHRHLVGRFHLVRPKSKKGRRIMPMVPWMENALRHLFDTTPPNEFGLVWPDADGMPRDAADDRAEWYAMQEQAGIAHPSGRHYKGHEGRHTTATLLLELGVPKDVVEAIMGHSKFVESYDHSDVLPKVRAALEQLADRLALTA